MANLTLERKYLAEGAVESFYVQDADIPARPGHGMRIGTIDLYAGEAEYVARLWSNDREKRCFSIQGCLLWLGTAHRPVKVATKG